LAACLLTVLCVPPASAGVEPSPFISSVSGQIEEVRRVFDSYSGEDRAMLLSSLDELDAKLRVLGANSSPSFGVDQESAERGALVVGRILSMLLNREASSLTSYESFQLVTAMYRIVSILFDPQPEPPGIVAVGLTVLDRVSWWLMFDPQPEPPGMEGVLAQGIGMLTAVSSIMFDPQPEPPGFVTLGFDVLDRISSVYFDPQPEPPGIASLQQLQSFYVMSQVAGEIERARLAGFQGSTIPRLTALHALSGHLLDATVRGDSASAAAQVGAMVKIAARFSR
jgi:hypothetical protein